MSEPQVTITLGRSGQVVKRVGSKRFIRSDGLPSANKRLREYDIEGRPGDKRFDDSGMTWKDLRLKLPRKRRAEERRKSEQRESSEVSGMTWKDLRLKLPRKRRAEERRKSEQRESSEVSGMTWKDLRLKLLRKRRAEERRKSEQREKLLKAVRHPARANMLRREPQPNRSSLLRQYPSKEILDEVHPENSLRHYSSQTRNGLRARSPDRVRTTSRRLSPPRTFSDLRQVPAIRTADISRTGPFLSKEAFDSSRQTTLTPLKATAEAARPAVPTGRVMLKSSHMVAEPLNVASLLHSLGLGKYAITFQAEEVDMTALKQMSDKDLKELGIPMGPRKKILLSLQPRSKRQPP